MAQLLWTLRFLGQRNGRKSRANTLRQKSVLLLAHKV
jgi:hypothetical protein